MTLLPLDTARLRLRRFRTDDLARFVAYRSEPAVARFQSWPAPYPEADGAALIAEMVHSEPGKPGSWYQVAIEHRDSGVLVGDCAFCVLAENPSAAEIGFTLAGAHQKKGYGHEAVSRLIEGLFSVLGLERVQAMCDTENVGSIRLLERLGMSLAGHFVDSYCDAGEWRSEYAYAVERQAWSYDGGTTQGAS